MRMFVIYCPGDNALKAYSQQTYVGKEKRLLIAPHHDGASFLPLFLSDLS